MEVDVSPNQIETHGSIKYILIGDVGQTKEDELYKYYLNLEWHISFEDSIVILFLCAVASYQMDLFWPST